MRVRGEKLDFGDGQAFLHDGMPLLGMMFSRPLWRS